MTVSDRRGGKDAPHRGAPSGSPLDNPVWHALQGRLGGFGQSLPRAARFDPQVAVFAALADDGDPGAWADLARLIGAGKRAFLFRPSLDVPPGWTTGLRIPCLQMIGSSVVGSEDDRLVALGPDDVPEMLSLVADTDPGPFAPRTVELGGYIGFRPSGRLVAMAGQRLALPGFTEVSAVCTADDHRRRGLATALVLTLAYRIRASGDEPIMHVAAGNERAVRLYRSLGFTVRRQLDVLAVRAPAGG